MDRQRLASFLDFANHHQEATPEDIKILCQKVKQYRFHSAFVNPCYVALAKDLLSEGIVGTVISFPLGQDTRDIKILAAINAVRIGADELDVMMNVGLFKAGKQKEVLEEMKAVIEAAKEIRSKVIVKFIIETGLLTDEEIKKASQLVLKSGADFLKICSGLGPRGASLKDVELVKGVVADKIRIKVAGGVDTYKEAIDFINKGVARIGTSHAVEIIEGYQRSK